MVRRRLLQLAGLSLMSGLLTTQGMARSETMSPSALLSTHRGTEVGWANPRQGPGALAAPAAANQLLLLIDGSKTPELISDSLAFGHFVRATVAPTDSTDEALTRQRLVLAPLQLSDPDRWALLQAFQVVRHNLDRIETQRRAVRASDAAAPAAIRRLSDEQAQLFEGARKHLNNVLTPAGASRLNAYLSGEVKRRIKAYGDLPH